MMVRETGSFRAAAHALGVQPSAVSRRVAALEDRLGVSLFERRRSGARPTNAGRLFQDEIRSVLARLDTAVRYVQAAGRADNGRLDIGVMALLSSRFLSRLIRTFKSQSSAITLTMTEGGYHEHAAAIVDGSLDVAFVLGELRPEGAENERLWTEAIMAALPSDDPRA